MDKQQLIKKNQGGGYQDIYPKTFIDAIRDKESGMSLSDILNGFNMYFLPYVGSPESTRLLVPKLLRRQGLWITYVKYDKTVVTEWYAGEDISDKAWKNSSNWRIGNNNLVGDITISSDGNWVVNGENTGVKAQGEPGITPLLQIQDNKLQVSYTNGTTWNTISDYIAAWFRISATSATTAGDKICYLQISRDEGKTWSNLGEPFTNSLHIKGYVSSTGSLPSNAVNGDIYGVGPTYDTSDSEHTNPIYNLYVKTSDGWVDNGKFTSIAAGVVQELGDSETEIISQKVVTNKFNELENKANSLCFLLNGEETLDVDFNNKVIHVLKEEIVISYGIDNKYIKINVSTEDIDIPEIDGLYIIGLDVKNKSFVILPYESLPSKDIYTIIIGHKTKIIFSTSEFLFNGHLIEPIINEKQIEKNILAFHLSLYKNKDKQDCLFYAPNLFYSSAAVAYSLYPDDFVYMFVPVIPGETYVTNTSVNSANLYDINLNIISKLTIANGEVQIPASENNELYVKLLTNKAYADILFFKKKGTGTNIQYYGGENSDDNSILGADSKTKSLIKAARVYGEGDIYKDTLCIGYIEKTSSKLSIYLNTISDLSNPEQYDVLENILIDYTGKSGIQTISGGIISLLIDFDYLNSLQIGVISNTLTGGCINGNVINKSLILENKPLSVSSTDKYGARKIKGYVIEDNIGFLPFTGGEVLLIEIDRVMSPSNTLQQIMWDNLNFGEVPSNEYKYYAFFTSDNIDNSGLIKTERVPYDTSYGHLLNTDIPIEAKYFALTTCYSVKSPDALLFDSTNPYINNERVVSMDLKKVDSPIRYVNNPPVKINLLNINRYYPFQVWWGGTLLQYNRSCKSCILYLDHNKKSVTISGFKTNSKNDYRVWRIFSCKGEEIAKGYVSYDSSLVTEGVEITIPPVTVDLPSDAFFMVITIKAELDLDLSTAKIEYGNESTEYSPYREYIQPFNPVESTSINQGNQGFENIHWDVFGDSKTDEYYDGVRNWSYYVQQKLGVGLRNNYAKSGAHWEDFETSIPRQKFSQQVIDAIAYNDANNLTPNLITISIGTNSLWATTGDFDEIMAVEWGENGSSIDRTTLFGGMRWGIETLKRKYPSAIILASSPLPRSNTSFNNQIPTMISNMKKLLDEYGIPLLNLYTNGQYAPIIDKTIISNDPKTEGNWWHYDGLHDSNNGAQVTAKVWGAFIFPYLNMM